MTTTQIVVTAVLVIVVIAVIAAVWTMARRASLRRRFGGEYDRLVSEQHSRPAAEKELRERERRHAQLELHPPGDADRARYAQGWQQIQAQFVDDPRTAVAQADTLVTELVAQWGYPTRDYEQQLAHLSVEHARVLAHYRDAHEINRHNEQGQASTEQLRQALVHYRALFADLLGTELAPAEPTAATRHPQENR